MPTVPILKASETTVRIHLVTDKELIMSWTPKELYNEWEKRVNVFPVARSVEVEVR